MKTCLLLLLLVTLIRAQVDQYALRDMKLFVNGKEWIVKGIAYQPVPLGYNADAGLCSIRYTPFSEWKSACYDSDYFDGSVNQRDPPAPAGGWFKGLWTRDLPLLKEAGVNTVRVYLANAITANASVEQLGSNFITSPTGKYHVPFFDTVQSFGMKVIWPLVSDHDLIVNTATDEFQTWLRNQIDEVGNHPALLMYSLGNELPGFNNASAANRALVEKVNGYIDLEKWGRWIPFSTALIDANQYYDYLASVSHVDIMMLNIYRGTDFSDLFTGRIDPFPSAGVTAGWHALSCQYNMPTLLGELGWHQNDNAMNTQVPNWWNQLYKSVLSSIDLGAIGSVYFEYSDEPYKTDPLQQTMGIVRFQASTANGLSSATSTDFWVPDAAVRKTDVNIWTSFVSGSVNGVPVNYNSDEYTIIGRPQATYANSFSICTAYPTAATTSVPTDAAGTTIAATTAAANSGSLSTAAAATNAAVTSAASTSQAAADAATTSSAAATSATDAPTSSASVTSASVPSTSVTQAASATSSAATTSRSSSVTSSGSLSPATSGRPISQDSSPARRLSPALILIAFVVYTAYAAL